MNIEYDEKILKSNYESRANYSIENAILEKRLWHDKSLLRGETTIHNMTDLKVYYDRQLSKIKAIVKESIGIERKPIQLIAKVLPLIEYHICTSFGASSEFYQVINNR